MYPQPWAFDNATQSQMLGRHPKGTANIVYADGHVLSGSTNKTWRSVLDYRTTDHGPQRLVVLWSREID